MQADLILDHISDADSTEVVQLRYGNKLYVLDSCSLVLHPNDYDKLFDIGVPCDIEPQSVLAYSLCEQPTTNMLKTYGMLKRHLSIMEEEQLYFILPEADLTPQQATVDFDSYRDGIIILA